MPKTRRVTAPVRPPHAVKPKTVRIPVKRKTAENLRLLHADLLARLQVAQQAQLRFEDTLRSIYSEHGIAEAKPIEVTERAPYELVLEVTKLERAT